MLISTYINTTDNLVKLNSGIHDMYTEYIHKLMIVCGEYNQKKYLQCAEDRFLLFQVVFVWKNLYFRIFNIFFFFIPFEIIITNLHKFHLIPSPKSIEKIKKKSIIKTGAVEQFKQITLYPCLSHAKVISKLI